MEEKKNNSLSAHNPELLSEWDYEKNNISPDEITYGSHTKVWWKCKNGHSWFISVNHRASKGRGCPYCCANPMLLRGENDLATIYPDIAKQWHHTKNGDLSPSDVTSKSSKKVWWICEKGHEWKTMVNHRANGSGCPKCAKGRQTSFPEQAIYYYVKQSCADAINGYTEIFNNHGMELDVYIPSKKLGIEYDGIAFHRNEMQRKREIKKYSICKEYGIKLIKLRESSDDYFECDELIYVHDNLNKAISQLSKFIEMSDINVERDKLAIQESYFSALKENSLSERRPDIAKDWDYVKNGSLTPEMFFSSSNEKIWWKCDKNHSWQASIDSRNRGTGCPYCSNNKILVGYNDLCTLRPDLVEEWDYEKNTDVEPTQVSKGSGKVVWWKCKKGHSWKAEINGRNKGAGCPICGIEKGQKRRIENSIKNKKCSLQEMSPELSNEWHPNKNGELRPSQVTNFSKKKVWWLGKCGHEWEAVIGNRSRGAGCPYCYRNQGKTLEGQISLFDIKKEDE